MKTLNSYLIVSRSGRIEVRKSRPSLSSDEVSFMLKINLPDDFFERIIPVIEVAIPKEAVYSPDAELVMNLLSSEMAEKLELEASSIRDGLIELLKNKIQKEEKTP